MTVINIITVAVFFCSFPCLLRQTRAVCASRWCQAVSSRFNPRGEPVFQRRSAEHIPPDCQPAAADHTELFRSSGIKPAELQTMTNQMLKDMFQLCLLQQRLTHVQRGKTLGMRDLHMRRLPIALICVSYENHLET